MPGRQSHRTDHADPSGGVARTWTAAASILVTPLVVPLRIHRCRFGPTPTRRHQLRCDHQETHAPDRSLTDHPHPLPRHLITEPTLERVSGR